MIDILKQMLQEQGMSHDDARKYAYQIYLTLPMESTGANIPDILHKLSEALKFTAYTLRKRSRVPLASH